VASFGLPNVANFFQAGKLNVMLTGCIMNRQRLHIYFSGRVQGVGFRYATRMLARGFEVTGTVRNMPDGRVEMVAEGDRAELDAFLQAIRDSEVGCFIRQEDVRWTDAKNEFRGFEIVR
jgi:acylphosphatase